MDLWTDMTKAIVVLHNFSIKGQENHSDIIETAYVGNISKVINLGQVASNNYRKNTKRIRDDYKKCFSSGSGTASWQNAIITRAD